MVLFAQRIRGGWGESGEGFTLENELVWGLARSLLMGSKPTATEFFT